MVAWPAGRGPGTVALDHRRAGGPVDVVAARRRRRRGGGTRRRAPGRTLEHAPPGARGVAGRAWTAPRPDRRAARAKSPHVRRQPLAGGTALAARRYGNACRSRACVARSPGWWTLDRGGDPLDARPGRGDEGRALEPPLELPGHG